MIKRESDTYNNNMVFAWYIHNTQVGKNTFFWLIWQNTSTGKDVRTAMSKHSSVKSEIFHGLPKDWSNL